MQFGFQGQCYPCDACLLPFYVHNYSAAEILGRTPRCLPGDRTYDPSQGCRSSCPNLDITILCTKTFSRWKKYIYLCHCCWETIDNCLRGQKTLLLIGLWKNDRCLNHTSLLLCISWQMHLRFIIYPVYYVDGRAYAKACPFSFSFLLEGGGWAGEIIFTQVGMPIFAAVLQTCI